MKVVMLYGAPGVGKLTTGKALQRITGYRLFHNHLTVDLVAAVFDFGTVAFREVREQIWLDVMRRAAREQVPGLIFTFVFEPTVLPGFVERLTAVLTSEGATLHPVELRCEVNENLRRVQAPDRAHYLKTRNAADVRSGIEAGVFLAPTAIPGTIGVDITSSQPEETALRIIDALGLS
ncbi:MAG: AAA family ATPase [Dehalococcoidia bacterium]